MVLPLRGIQEWHRPGQALHDAAGHAAFVDELRRAVRPPLQLVEIEAHINDAAFTESVLAIFDRWVEQGLIAAGASQA